MRYRISQAAISDLDEIWIYTQEKWSTKQADKYYREIISEIDYLTRNFESGRPMTQIRIGYRTSKVKHMLCSIKWRKVM